MSIQVAQFIEDLYKKAGGEISPEIKEALSKKGLDQIPDEIGDAIHGGLISLDVAKEHKDVRNAIRGEMNGQVETILKQIYRDVMGGSADDWRELRGDKDEKGKYSKDIISVGKELAQKMDPWKSALVKANEGKGADEVRAELEEKFKSELDELRRAKAANENTIHEYENKFKEQNTTWETKWQEREQAYAQENMRRKIFDDLRNNFQYQSKYQENGEWREFHQMKLNKIVDSVMNSNEFVLKETDEGFKMYNPENPTALALNGKNEPRNFNDHLKELVKDMLDPNGGKGGSPTPPGGGGLPDPKGKPQNGMKPYGKVGPAIGV